VRVKEVKGENGKGVKTMDGGMGPDQVWWKIDAPAFVI